jgi:hypothetical protein
MISDPKSNSQNNLNHRYRWLLVILFGTIAGGYFVYTGLIKSAIELLNRPPRPIPTYSSSTVLEVCNLLNLSPDDSFCREPSSQNPESFEAMLERNFPIGGTRFDDLMALLISLPSRSKGTSFEGKDFEPNGCQTFLEDNYECGVIFPGDINIVRIAFANKSRIVTYYGVTKNGS